MAAYVRKRKKSRVRIFFNKYINGTKGVISLFLAILMLPFTFIAGSLINAARVDSAVAIFDEALCNASDSTLGTYDAFLRKRFGLLAMSQELEKSSQGAGFYTTKQFLNETFEFYMQENMKVLSNTYTASDYTVEGEYPLSNSDVLLEQILEYGKYGVSVKLVEDALSLDNWVSKLEKAVFGSKGTAFIKLGTSVADAGTALVDLSGALDKLKEAIDVQETKTKEYNEASGGFAGAVSGYVTLWEEKKTKLEALKQEIDSCESTKDAKEAELKAAQAKLSAAVTTADKTKYQKEVDDAEKEYDSASAELTQKENEYTETEKNYNEKLAGKAGEIGTKKAEYITAIENLTEALGNTKTHLGTVQDKMKDLGTKVGKATADGVGAMYTSSKDANDKNIKKLEGEDKEGNQEQIKTLKNENKKLDNTKEVVTTAIKDGSKSMFGEMKESVSDFDTAVYDGVIQELGELKGKVEAYSLSDPPAELGGEYYKSIGALLTKEAVEKVGSEIVQQCTKSSVLGILKAVVSFFEALLNLQTLYDPKLGAVIDKDYYNDTYGGLPSKKDRDLYPLNNGRSEDAKLSEYYKEIIGGYGTVDLGTDNSFDLFGKLGTIFDDINKVIEDVKKLKDGLKLSEIGKLINDIGETIKEMADFVGAIFAYIGNIITNAMEALGQKILLTGYMSYMLSDRTTYEEGSALTGAKFKLRGQDTTETFLDSSTLSIINIVSTISHFFSEDKEKCFVGAEKEYVFFGSMSEVANQSAAFGAIYLFRCVLNIAPILLNKEVATIAGSTTIFAPVVYILYIFLEPLLDTLILVNGEEVNLWKGTLFLTPSGIGDLFKKFTNMSLNNAQLEKAQKDLMDSWGAGSAYEELHAQLEKESGGEDNPLWDFLDMDYSGTLFILMTVFCSSEKMVERFSDVVEMEAVQNLCKQKGDDARFDLDYSYTYLRTEGTFSMNEFIPMSANNKWKSKKRIIYRGY